jgi:hypothetical protein
LFSPKNYDECILENMKNVKTDQAASAVAYACDSKFPTESKNKKLKMVRCNGRDIDPNEYAEVNFPVPNDFGSIKIIKLAWEPLRNYSNENVFRVYVQHSYPFSIQEFNLQGFTSKNLDDASYRCTGAIVPNAVGAAICQNVQNSSKTFSIKTVTTPQMNLYELHKLLKKCG